MLARRDINHEMKEMIYDALQERANDPNNITSTDIRGLPALDIKKLIDNLPSALPNQQLKKVRDKPISINTNGNFDKSIQNELKKRLQTGTAIGKVKG